MKNSTQCPAWRTPQIEALKAAVDAANSGEFASDEEVRAVFERYAGHRARTDEAQPAEAPRVKRNLPPPR